jgi:thioredoxin
MKKLLFIATLALGASTYPPVQAKLCSLCPSDNFENLIATNENVFVDFYAPWCGPCKAMKPHFEALGKTTEMNDVLFITVNVDTFSSLASKYGIRSIPVLKAFKNGKEVTTSVGGKSKNELLGLVNKYLLTDEPSAKRRKITN